MLMVKFSISMCLHSDLRHADVACAGNISYYGAQSFCRKK